MAREIYKTPTSKETKMELYARKRAEGAWGRPLPTADTLRAAASRGRLGALGASRRMWGVGSRMAVVEHLKIGNIKEEDRRNSLMGIARKSFRNSVGNLMIHTVTSLRKGNNSNSKTRMVTQAFRMTSSVASRRCK